MISVRTSLYSVPSALPTSPPGDAPDPVDVLSSFSLPPVPVLELIFSCIQPSQELLPSPSPQYSSCSFYCGVEENTGYGGQGDAGSVPEEEQDKTRCYEGHGCEEHGRSSGYCRAISPFECC